VHVKNADEILIDELLPITVLPLWSFEEAIYEK
jgi:hypothetical protein